MTKAALGEIPPFTLFVLQLGASVAVLWVLVLATGQTMPFTRAVVRPALSGVLEPGLAYGASIPGLLMTSAATASVILAAEPLLIAALACMLFSERPALRTWLTIVCGMGGVILITATAGEAGERHIDGDLLVLAGTAFAALYVVASSRFVVSLQPLVLAVLQQTAGLLFAVALLTFSLLAGIETWRNHIPLHTLLLGAFSGIVQYALAFWLYLFGLKYLPLNTAGLFHTLIPVFGVGGAVVFLGEAFGPAQWFGCVIVVMAVASIARRGASAPYRLRGEP
jgi:drug/metabolite transporter (DMT)-like permease